MTIYTAVDLFVSIFESLMIFMLFDAYLEKREHYSQKIYAGVMFFLALMIVTSNHVFNFGLLNAIFIIFMSVLSSFLFKGDIKTKIIISVLDILLLGIIEIIVLFAMAFIGGNSVTKIVDDTQLRLFGIIASKMLTFAVVKVICIKAKKSTIKYNTSYWILFFMIFATTVLAIFLIFKLQYDSGATHMNNVSVICSFGLLYSTFFALYLYENMAKQAETINRQKIFEQQVKAQAKHLDEILLSQKQLKSFRHDLRNHMTTLMHYFEADKNSEGLDYLEKIQDRIKLSNSGIETGNTALDAIINSKKTLAESKEIQFTTNIQIPESVSIEPTDVCIIFGNALDNAIEACDKITSGRKNISISIIYKNNSIITKITNTTNKNQNNNLKTTKENKKDHGFGIENIKTALSKYQNVLKITEENDNFILYFIIFQN